MTNAYMAIHPQILRIGTELTFDVFLRMSAEKFERLIKAGKIYSALIHIKIYKHSVPALFISKGEIDFYFTYLEDNFDDVFKDLLISPRSKAQIAHELVTSLAKFTLENPDPGIIKRYKKIIAILSQFIM